jgi:hypothetical protein
MGERGVRCTPKIRSEKDRSSLSRRDVSLVRIMSAFFTNLEIGRRSLDPFPTDISAKPVEMERPMIHWLKSSWCCLVLLSALGVAPALGAEPPPEGGTLPDFVLSVPEDSSHRQYLGLNPDGAFRVPQIQAEVVIIEIFSMY